MPEIDGVAGAYLAGQDRLSHRVVQVHEVLREVKVADGEPQGPRCSCWCTGRNQADRRQRACDRAQQPAQLIQFLPAHDSQPADGIVAGPLVHQVPGRQIPRITEEEHRPGVTAEPGIRLIGCQGRGELNRALDQGLRIEFSQDHGNGHIGHFQDASVQAPLGPPMAAIQFRFKHALYRVVKHKT